MLKQSTHKLKKVNLHQTTFLQQHLSSNGKNRTKNWKQITTRRYKHTGTSCNEQFPHEQQEPCDTVQHSHPLEETKCKRHCHSLWHRLKRVLDYHYFYKTEVFLCFKIHLLVMYIIVLQMWLFFPAKIWNFTKFIQLKHLLSLFQINRD